MSDKEYPGESCNAADADEWKAIARNTIEKWTQLDALATEVVCAAHHGDQHFIQCLRDEVKESFSAGQQYITCSVLNDERKTRLRLAIVKLADWLREN